MWFRAQAFRCNRVKVSVMHYTIDYTRKDRRTRGGGGGGDFDKTSQSFTFHECDSPLNFCSFIQLRLYIFNICKLNKGKYKILYSGKSKDI